MKGISGGGFEKLTGALGGSGAFLVVAGGRGAANIMTIGWAQTGVIWGKPVMTVLVRPSRFTHGLIEKAEYFSVCVPPAGKLAKELAFCGSRSGREHDKAAECGLVLAAGERPGLSYIAGSELVYECAKLARSRVEPENLDAGVKKQYYPDGDYHYVYFGEILGVHKG